MNQWFFSPFLNDNLDRTLFDSLFPDTYSFYSTEDGKAVPSIHDTYYTLPHSSSPLNSHISFILCSNWCTQSVHRNKQKGLFDSPASCVHRRIYPSHAQWDSECRIQSCSKTCRNLHPQCSCGSVSLKFTLSSGHKRKISGMDSLISSWANECRSTFCMIEGGIAFRQGNELRNNYRRMDIFVLFRCRGTCIWSRNFLLSFCPFNYDSSCTFYGCAWLWCCRGWFWKCQDLIAW